MNNIFKQRFFTESYGDEEMRIRACPKCGPKNPDAECPLCNGYGLIIPDDDESNEVPEMQRPPLSKGDTLANYGYNSGDDYVTGGF